VQQLIYSAAPNAIPTNIKSSTLIIPELTETPRIIKSEIMVSGIDHFRSLRKTRLSSAEILEYLRLHPNLDGRKSDSLRTLLHSRLAAPWICFVVVLIAIPFGSLSGRRNVFVGVASSVFICFVFFIAKDLALALGSGGYVPPSLAAWLPNVLFAATGVGLIRRVR
jgi:lipopolysaccharide export system permease protein